MELSTLLISLGLSKNESKIYLTLLKGGTQTISRISRESGLHRPAIYSTLPTLKGKGLISQGRVGKLMNYAAEPPERLRSLLKEVHEELDTVIPKLSEMQNKRTPVVRRLDGKAGVHAVFEDIVNTLKKGEEFYRYSSEGEKVERTIWMPESYIEARTSMKLERLVITNPGYLETTKPTLEETVKTVPKEFLPFDHGISQIIYGDKIAFIDFNQPIATILENPALAKFQKDIFKMLFRRL